MLECVILIGLQASGKTTFYEKYFSLTHMHISKDLMPSVKDRKVRQEKLMIKAFEEDQSVVIDNTNVSINTRQSLIDLAHRYQALVFAYYFVPLLQRNLKLNHQRQEKARVPDVAIYTMAKNLEPPSKKEGIDRCFQVILDENFNFEINPYF